MFINFVPTTKIYKNFSKSRFQYDAIATVDPTRRTMQKDNAKRRCDDLKLKRNWAEVLVENQFYNTKDSNTNMMAYVNFFDFYNLGRTLNGSRSKNSIFYVCCMIGRFTQRCEGQHSNEKQSCSRAPIISNWSCNGKPI